MTTSDDISSCLATHDPNALPVAVAQAVVRRFAVPVAATERIALRSALGRVLAEDVVSTIDVPAHDNSAMDGYAFDGTRLGGGDPSGLLTLDVVGQALAGHPFNAPLGQGQAVRIMTGAPIPPGCDTVVPQELVTREPAGGTRITFATGTLARGANRRGRGEDLPRGGVALAAGRTLRASDLGLVASLGIGEIVVRRRVRVAFFSTGDELRSLGEPLATGCVYDSNRYTLFAMLERLGAETLDLGIVRDDPAALEAALRTAADCADVVITSGGVSVGDADLTRRLFATLGDVAFWQMAMRPGRPLAFGRIRADGQPVTGNEATYPSVRAGRDRPALFFGLPGNPVAVMVTFYVIVRDALIAMAGADASPPLQFAAATTTALKKRAGRTEFLRGVAARGPDGNWQVTPTRSQGSGVLSAMSEANCFIVLPHDQADVAAGSAVEIMPFDGLI